MKICTFFGHRDAPSSISLVLQRTITNLIINENVTHFLIGNNGNFDTFAKNILEEKKKEFSQINYEIVLAHIPSKGLSEYGCHTVYPEGLEMVPQRFAIAKRNEWMINQSDFVITYVKKTHGGAQKYKEMARKKGKRIIEI